MLLWCLWQIVKPERPREKREREHPKKRTSEGKGSEERENGREREIREKEEWKGFYNFIMFIISRGEEEGEEYGLA